VAKALAASGGRRQARHWEKKFLEAQERGFVPAGRINSAAGTDTLTATLINCFVQPVGDSITESSTAAPASTPRWPGRRDHAPRRRRRLRLLLDPPGRARFVKGTQSRASGPVSYMRVFDRSCETVESAGARRGAQMGVLRCDHPDIEEFIHAKDRAT
jgi:ribonucleoside-diphosphate reductase alpha chain